MALSTANQTADPIKETLENVFVNELNICLPIQKDLRLRRVRKLAVKPDPSGSTFERQESNDSATAALEQYLVALTESQGETGVNVMILDYTFQRDGPDDSGTATRSLETLRLSPSSLPRMGEEPDYNAYTPCDPAGNLLEKQYFSFGMTLWSASWSTTNDGSCANAVVTLHSNKPSFNSRFDIAGEELGVLDRTLRSMRSYSDHPCYVGFCIACTAIVRIAALLNDHKEKLRNVDVGLEQWARGGRFAGRGDLVPECIEVDINLEWLARHIGCLKLVRGLLDTLESQLQAFEARSTSNNGPSRQQKNLLLREAIEGLRRRCESLTIMTEHLKERAKAQSAFILNLCAQREDQAAVDNPKPIERRIIESKRESEPMDNLAIITKVVLPSTFLASFLATSMFWWAKRMTAKKVN